MLGLRTLVLGAARGVPTLPTLPRVRAVTRSHTTVTGCTVTVRAVGPSVEIVVRQRDGRSQTFACGWRDARTIGTMIIETTPLAEPE